MVGKLLARGMLAGFVAGVITFGFAKVVGEPAVDSAIALEEQGGHTHSHGDDHGAADASDAVGTADAGASHAEDHEQELVSRSTQAGIGLLTGVVVFGTAVGGLFSLVFAYAYGRAGKLDARTLSAWLALGAFIGLVIVPSLKYPANPPAVGDPDTIGYRTGLHFLLIAISLAVMVLSTQVRRALLPRRGAWNASLIAGALFIVVMAFIELALPSYNEVPGHFPASLLWQFRMASLGMQAILWSVIGLLFGWLVERHLGGNARLSLAQAH